MTDRRLGRAANWLAERNPLLVFPALVAILTALILLLSWLVGVIIGSPGVNLGAALGGAVGTTLGGLTIFYVGLRQHRRRGSGPRRRWPRDQS